MGKKSRKRKLTEEIEENDTDLKSLPAVRYSDEPVVKKVKWINRQRVLVLASRGINHRDRHLMEDIKKLMPHHKPQAKMERSKSLSVLNEICEMENCNKAVLFEGRKKRDLYVWLSNIPSGPSMRFLVENVHTMAELKMTGNCLRGSRPLLSFDPSFDEKPHYRLLKELLTQIFGVPNHHPKSQPFFDHVFTFTVLDNRIWFRNFQILSEDGALSEIGPRFVLNPIKIFSGSFGGVSLWENPHYISPSKYRQQLRINANEKYIHRVQKKMQNEEKTEGGYELTPLEDIFKSSPLEKAKSILEQESKSKADESNNQEGKVTKTKKLKKGISAKTKINIVKTKKIK